jgi:RNA 2',3'-cyclic 3'-phosphodiesterase
MRAFIAIDLPEPARAVVRALQQPLPCARGVRLTRPEKCHLTLKFLGEIEAERAPALLAALAEIRERAFELSFTSLGTFPNARRPRVVWIGVTRPPELDRLARAVDRATPEVVLDKPFRPHVTLARIDGRGVRLEQSVLEQEAPPCRFVVSEFALFESVLGAEGAKYRVLGNFSLES